jgi:hypothetical protein
MKRRLYLSAVLAGASLTLAPAITRAQDAPPAETDAQPGETPPEEGPAEEAPAADQSEPESPEPAPTETPPAAEPETTEGAGAPPDEVASPAQQASAAAEATAPTDELPDAGYVPGYRRRPTLGLTPWTPVVPALPGGLTSPPGAPAPSDTWNFNFTGYFSAALKAAIANRTGEADEGQSDIVLKTPPVTADCYGCFTGTGSVLGSWVQMTFAYGNRTTTATASINTYNPSRPASYTQISTQYFIGDAYLTFRVPQIDKFRLAWAVGAFSLNYGQLGRYSNLYGNTFLGGTTGTGEYLAAEYDLTDTLTLQAEHGFFGTFGKAPIGITENQSSGWADAQDPAPWTQVARLGVVKSGETLIQGGLVFMYNWAQDDTAYEPAGDDQTRPAPPAIQDQTVWDEGNPKDPSFWIVGLESRVRGLWYHFGLAAGYAKITDGWNLRGTRFWVAGDAKNMTYNWVGPESGGNGTMWGVGTEFQVSWGSLVRLPEPFYDDGWNFVSTLAVQGGAVNSKADNPARDFTMYKVGLDNRYKPIKWLAVALRADRVVPDTSDSDTTFHVLAPRLEFQTDWTSHETITLQYAHWFYGSEPPYINNNTQNLHLDTDVVSFGFGMWW